MCEVVPDHRVAADTDAFLHMLQKGQEESLVHCLLPHQLQVDQPFLIGSPSVSCNLWGAWFPVACCPGQLPTACFPSLSMSQ